MIVTRGGKELWFGLSFADLTITTVGGVKVEMSGWDDLNVEICYSAPGLVLGKTEAFYGGTASEYLGELTDTSGHHFHYPSFTSWALEAVGIELRAEPVRRSKRR